MSSVAESYVRELRVCTATRRQFRIRPSTFVVPVATLMIGSIGPRAVQGKAQARVHPACY